jgi:tetratricopeptide (TPR) repeat protein
MQLMGESGQLDAAIAELEQYREQTQAKDVNLLLDLATLYLINKDYASAVQIYSEVLSEDPENAPVFKLRADAHLFLGRQSEAMADYEATLKIRPEDDGVLNNLAWLLATSPDEELRDGKRSIELATEACELTDYKRPHILSTLASGYAEIGDFETAINWSKKAVELAGESLKDALTKELESYQQGKPWREAMPPEPQVDFSPPGDSEAPSVETPSPDESQKPQPEGKSSEPEEPAQEPAPEGEPSKP